MPSENPPARLRATDVSPTWSSTLPTRRAGRPLLWAIHSRWSWARRPGWTAPASRRAPTSVRGVVNDRYGWPPISADPASGASSPSTMRIVVDLPAPLGPTNPVTWPGLTVKVRSSTATVPPYRFRRPATSMAARMAETLGMDRAGVVTPQRRLAVPRRWVTRERLSPWRGR